MKTILSPKSISLSKLNNAEYTYFAGQIVARVDADGVEALHTPEATFTAYSAGYRKMVDIVAQSRISAETAEIAAIDAEEDSVIVYLLGVFRNAKSSPLAAKKTAGTALYNATKPYIGIQGLPQRQQVQKVDGLLNDLAKADLAAHITTLGLKEEVEQLTTLNTRYRTLLESRASTQLANTLEDSKAVRAEMDVQYNEIVTTAFAFSVATPTDVLTNFIVFVNKLIDDTNTAYNQRMAQSKKNGSEKPPLNGVPE